MSEMGTERAARVADLMQMVARLLVLVIIIPSAIWLAVFSLLTDVIPDSVVRGLFSLTFGLGLAGVLVARMKYPVRGSILTVLAAAAGALSLAIVWNQLYLSLAILHVFLIILLGIFRYLRLKLELSFFRWLSIRSLLAILIVATAPLPILVFFFPLGISLLLLGAIAGVTVWLYCLGVQYLLRDAKFGILNSILPALGASLLLVENHLTTVIFVAPVITTSVWFLAFGLCLLLCSQIFRFIQQSITSRPEKKYSAELRKAELLRSVGIEIEESDKQFAQQTSPVDTVWLINRGHAQILSGFSLIIIASGIPAYFMWLVEGTAWVAEILFPYLFVPLAVLLTMLVLIPSPVMFRLGDVIKRSQESKIVRILGLMIVSDASFGLFFWMQFYMISFSLPLTIVLFVSGITGIFKEIRLLWKAAWIRISNVLRRMWGWICVHSIAMGLLADMAVTSLLAFFFLYPFSVSSGLHMPFLFISSSSVLMFTLLGLVGVAALRSTEKKRTFASLGISVLLLCISSLSYWFYSPGMDSLSAISVASVWFIGFALLQVFKISRRILSLPFLIGLIGLALNIYTYEMFYSTFPIPLLSITCVLLVSAAMLHHEYSRALTVLAGFVTQVGIRIANALRRIGGLIRTALIRVGSTIRRSLVRLGGLIYRGAVWLGVQIVRFVLVLYAAVLLYLIGNFGYGFIIVTSGIDSVYLLSGLTLLFFLLFTPSLVAKGIREGRGLLSCIIISALSFGFFVFSLTNWVDMMVRIPFSIFLTLMVLIPIRSRMHERIQNGLPYLAWTSFVVWISSIAYLSFLPDFIFAVLISSFIAGLGSLPLRLNERLLSLSSVLFLVLCVPTGTLAVYIASANALVPTILVLVLLPCVVFYKQYAAGMAIIAHAFIVAGQHILSGLRYIGGKIITGARIVGRFVLAGIHRVGSAISIALRYILLVIASHIIVFMAILATGYTVFLVYSFLPLIQSFVFWEIHIILDSIILFSISWIPSLVLRRADYQRLLSASIVLFAISLGGLTYLTLVTDTGITSALLLAMSFTFFIASFGTATHHQRTASVGISLAFVLFFVLSFLALESLYSLSISVLGLSFLSIPFLSSSQRWRFIYPVVSVTILAVFSYAIVLPITGPLLALTGFVLMETLFLMLPSETRSWQVWWTFCFSSGYVIYSFLSTILSQGLVSYLQFIMPVFVVIELLRLTPDIEYRFSEFSEQLGIVRALLLSIALFLILPIESIMVSAEITILVFIAVMTVSIWKEASEGTRFRLINLIAICFSILAGTYLVEYRSIDVFTSYYFAFIPIVISLIYSSYESKQPYVYWSALRLLLTVTFSLIWFTGYRTLESLLLGIPTGLFAGSLLSSWTPWSGFPQQGLSKFFCGSVIIFLESVWIWYSLFVFFLPGNILLVVASVLLISLVAFPMTKNQSWIDFELTWDGISLLIAITSGALLSGWDIFLLELPPNPLLTLGWGLSIFSILSGSMLRYNELSQGGLEDDRIAHKAWLLSIPGWTLLGFSFSAPLIQPELVTGITALSFCAASILYVGIHPSPSRNLKLAVNLMLAFTICYMSWLWLAIIPPVERFALTAIIWMVLETPTLGSYFYAGLVKVYAVARANSANIALVLPIIVGIWFGSTFLFQASCPLLLGLDIRPFFQALAVAAVSMGVIYFAEGFFLNGSISDRVRAPSVAILGRGILILLLSFTLPEAFPDLELVSYLLMGSITFSLIVVSALNLVFDFRKSAERSWMIAGLCMLPASYLGLVRFSGLLPTIALASAILLTFMMEAPFLKSQIAAAIALMSRFAGILARALRDLGATISRAFRQFAHAVRVFFERFGYINWVVFSLLFTTGLSYFSGSFFSDLIGMNPSSILYWIPRVSMPVMILGLLLLTVAIIRRTVKSMFGVSCVLVTLSGAAATGTLWLFDQGLVLISIAVAVILTSFGGLSVLFERKSYGVRISLFWIPIPIAIGLVIVSFLGTSSIAISLALMFPSLLLLLSTFTQLLQESLRDRFWLITSLTSGLATYTITSTSFQYLASFYLAVFIASIVLFPITFRVSKYLFAAPLFFAVTGYAFTSLIGEFMQGFPLALSPFLLFLALFIKEHERERPRLAYARLALLIILLGTIAIFGVSMMPFLFGT